MAIENLSVKVLKGSALAITLTLIGAVFAYLIRVIYSRTLTIENYGLFYAVFGLFSMLSTYADLGFAEAISYFIPKYLKKKNYSKLWNTFLYGQLVQIGVSVILALLIAIFTPFLAEKYFRVHGSETIIYIFCAFLVLNGFLNGINQIFTGLQKPAYFSTINTVKSFFIILFSSIAVFQGKNNLNLYGYIWLASYVLTISFYLYLLWSRHSFLTSNKFVKSTEFLLSLVKYAIPAFITTFIYSLMSASDIFFLTLFRGVIEVGIYNIIVPIASTSIIFLAPIHNILLPLTSHLMEGEKEKLGYILTYIYKIIPFIGAYFALFIVLFPSAIVSFIFGEKWLYLAGFPLSLLTIGYIFLLLGNLLGTVALGLGRMSERLNILLSVGILNIVLDAFFIWKFGVLGSVIMDSFIAVILVGVFTLMIRKYVVFKIDYFYYLKLLAISSLVFGLIRFIKIKPLNIGELILYGIIYTVLFAVIGLMLNIYDKKSLQLLTAVRNGRKQ